MISAENVSMLSENDDFKIELTIKKVKNSRAWKFEENHFFLYKDNVYGVSKIKFITKTITVLIIILVSIKSQIKFIPGDKQLQENIS